VSGIKTTGVKTLMLFGGRAYPELAAEVASRLGVDLIPTKVFNFANGEIYVRFEESVRGSDAFVIQSHAAPINEWIMEQLIMVDALKRASAKRITVVMPFYGYARQDKKHRGREPISARLIADLFKTAGANRLMAVDLHTAQIQGFFDGPVDHLWAMPILADYVAANYGTEQLAVVSPDAGRIRVAEMWSERLSGAPLAFIHKTRDINQPNEAVANRVVGDVTGRTCVVVDDMIDTGSTITKATEALHAAGAAEVVIAATHAVLSGPAVDRLKNARSSSPTRCRSPRTAISTSSPRCRSHRSSPARSARSSRTVRSPASSTATPDLVAASDLKRLVRYPFLPGDDGRGGGNCALAAPAWTSGMNWPGRTRGAGLRWHGSNCQRSRMVRPS
jgi:ribose-phosphate pyrophosphokinase